MRRSGPVIGVALLLTACAEQDAALPSAAPSPASPAQWIGRWVGPEGTWLEIARGDGNYLITIRNLDGARTFPALLTADGYSFERDGARESIRATDGGGTGMKWLAGKTTCVVVRLGEGYCR